MHGIYPALIVMSGMPGAHDIITILVELQVESDGIIRTATETVIPFVVAPRIYYLLHTSIRFVIVPVPLAIVGTLLSQTDYQYHRTNEIYLP